MSRRLTALFSALEALIAIAIGVAIPLVPLAIVWATQFGFAPDWTVFWRGAVDVWLLGHGVDVIFTLDPATAASLGLPGAETPVKVTIALLGFALLTLLLGARAGGRIAETGHRLLGSIVLLAVSGAGSLTLTLSALHPDARPSIVQGTLLPTLTVAIGLGIGLLRNARSPAAPGWPAIVRVSLGGALRAGTAAVAITTAVSAVAVALLIVGHYAELIRLYEALHTEVVGGLALTAGQLALLPNLVVWAASWFVGPGFAIGAGSHVSPLGTALGPVPAIPIIGAIPTGELAFGFVGLLVPVVAGFLAGAAVRPALVRALDVPRWPAFVATALGGGVVGGAMVGLLAWASAGSAGPGRLSEVGPQPLLVGAIAALEFAIAIAIGLAASIRRSARNRDRDPR